MIHHSKQSSRQCAHIWSDNLYLPYTRKLEVIRDQTTSNFLVYNLQLPHITSNFLMVVVVMVIMVVMLVMFVRTGQDRTGQVLIFNVLLIVL